MSGFRACTFFSKNLFQPNEEANQSVSCDLFHVETHSRHQIAHVRSWRKNLGNPHLPTMFEYPSIRICGGFGADMIYV